MLVNAESSADDNGHDDGHADEEEHDHENQHIVDTIMIMFICSLLTGVVMGWLLTHFFPYLMGWKRVSLPYTLAVFIAGFICAAVFDSEPDGYEMWTTAFHASKTMNPHIILLVILPPLIYESASDMNYHVFKKVLYQAIILAFPGMVMSLVLTGFYCHYTFDHDWALSVSLLLGAIVSATDPVAVVAALHELGAPAKLASVIDGESLLNDGSAMVMFFVFLEGSTGHGYTPEQGVWLFVKLAIGGYLWGAIMYWMVSTIFHITGDDWKIEVAAVMVGVYGTFAMAESAWKVSGIISVVTFGIYMSRCGKYAVSPHVEPVLHNIMSGLACFSETAIFFVAGVVTYAARQEAEIGGREWLNLFGLYIVLHFIRGFVIAVCLPFMNYFGGEAYAFSWKECAIMTFGGLRGAVGLALGMIVVEHAEIASHGSLDVKGAHQLNFYVSGIVILTMTINGILCVPVYKGLDIYKTNSFRQKMVEKVTADIEREMEEMMSGTEFQEDWLYGKADFEQIKTLLPDFSNVRVDKNNELVDLPKQAQVSVAIIGQPTWSSVVPIVPSGESNPAMNEATGASDDEKPSKQTDQADGQVLVPALALQSDEAVEEHVTSNSSWDVLEEESEIAETAFACLRQLYMEEYEDKSMDDDALYYVNNALEAAVDSMVGANPKVRTMSDAFTFELRRLNEVLPYKSLTETLVKMQVQPFVGVFARYRVFHLTFTIFEVLSGYIRAHEHLLHRMTEDRRVDNPAVLLDRPIALAKAQYMHWAEQFPSVDRCHRMIVTARILLEKKREIVQNKHRSGLLFAGDAASMGACINQTLARLQAMRFSAVLSNNHGKAWGRLKRTESGFKPVTPRPFIENSPP
jgi:NhaP-type Na+/H+ or K+/H+ antiporter